jgi:dimethylargininase
VSPGKAPLAITRAVSPAFAGCVLTHVSRAPIDLERARRQHAAYEAALRELGCRVQALPALPDHPDCVFVEDVAVVLDEVAVVTRPGAESRRGEETAVAEALAAHRPLVRIEAPGTLDGGDVLQLGRRVFAGRTARSNEAGRRQLRELLAPHGYEVVEVEVRGCLHLKTAVSAAGERTVVIHPPWVDPAPFERYERIEVDPAEPFAANVLAVGDAVLVGAAFPRTAVRLASRGLYVRAMEVDEIAKAEGGLTCCSVIVGPPAPRVRPARARRRRPLHARRRRERSIEPSRSTIATPAPSAAPAAISSCPRVEAT